MSQHDIDAAAILREVWLRPGISPSEVAAKIGLPAKALKRTVWLMRRDGLLLPVSPATWGRLYATDGRALPVVDHE